MRFAGVEPPPAGTPSGQMEAARAVGLCMGEYRRTKQQAGGRPVYKGGRNGTQAVWYQSGSWFVGVSSFLGGQGGSIYAVSTAATPDEVTAGEWLTAEGLHPNSSVQCTSMRNATS